MKAVRYHEKGGPEVLRLEEIPVPRPGVGEVLVRVEAAGANYADTVRRWGDHYPVPTHLPHTVGGELVGVVEEAGEGVATDWVGRRVFGAPDSGGYAEYAIVPARRIFPFPEGLDPVKGVALFIQGLSAALILKHAGRLAAGDDVFIEGAAGGLGLLATQLARLYGARTVFAGASTEQKRALTKNRGAHHAIDYSLPGWSKGIMEQTSGRGVDLVLEMTGGAVFEEAFGALAPQARVVAYGVASRKPFQIPSQRLIARGYSVIGFYLGLYLDRSELIGSTLAELADLVRRGDLKVDIGGTFPLSEATAMHQQLEGRGSAGKLVIIP